MCIIKPIVRYMVVVFSTPLECYTPSKQRFGTPPLNMKVSPRCLDNEIECIFIDNINCVRSELLLFSFLEVSPLDVFSACGVLLPTRRAGHFLVSLGFFPFAMKCPLGLCCEYIYKAVSTVNQHQ